MLASEYDKMVDRLGPLLDNNPWKAEDTASVPDQAASAKASAKASANSDEAALVQYGPDGKIRLDFALMDVGIKEGCTVSATVPIVDEPKPGEEPQVAEGEEDQAPVPDQAWAVPGVQWLVKKITKPCLEHPDGLASLEQTTADGKVPREVTLAAIRDKFQLVQAKPQAWMDLGRAPYDVFPSEQKMQLQLAMRIVDEKAQDRRLSLTMARARMQCTISAPSSRSTYINL